jgi:hypothetical protein
MLVSKTFYQVAGPLLYHNIVVNTENPLSSVLVGNAVVNRVATSKQAAAINFKNSLLSLIQHVTVTTHRCWRESFTGPLLRVPTLLIVPRADCGVRHNLCLDRVSCPTIAKIRPQKVVLHHSRLGDPDESDPDEDNDIAKLFPFTIRCPTLTLVLDETGCEEGRLRQEASYQQVNLNLLKELRIIIHKTPKWLDDIARRSTCSINEDFTIAGLASRMLGPVIHPIVTSGMIEITLYLFRQLDSTSIDALTAAIEADLSERQTSAGLDLVQQGRPRYTIKTLSDYISEGLEDELLPEELQYWREENQRRLKEGAGDFRAKQGGSERRQSRIPSRLL